MKKGLQLVYIILFLLVCALPVWGLVFTADLPEDLATTAQVDDYIDEEFYLREPLLDADATYMEALFQTASVDEVVVGKEDMLFFQETMDDFMGTNPLTERELQQIGHTISLVRDYATSQGCQFVFTIAPNKNSIYPDYMPDNYLPAQTDSNATRLADYVPNYVNLFDVLAEAPDMVYLYRDSHWNNYGAYLGFGELLKGLNAYEKLPIIQETTWIADFEPDLEGMLHPTDPVLENQIYYTFDGSYDFVSRYRGVDDLVIQMENPGETGDVVVFRDSFGNALIDYFGHSFATAHLSRVVPYDVDLAQEADYMVLEIVERNLDTLLDYAPVMPAPIVEDVGDAILSAGVMESEVQGDYTYVCGHCQGERFSVIYITADGVTYEAFPILDKRYEQAENQVGFAAYLPLDATPETIQIREIEE
ncbi:MAG: hypothetical protein R3Y62_06890 [Eubacteriales bacterium]